MPTAYPAALDAFVNPTTSSSPENPRHYRQHADANDAIEAIENELGLTPSGASSTVAERFTAIEAELGTNPSGDATTISARLATMATAVNPMAAPYNAVGDGVANDTTAIQSALTAAAGGEVILPEGTFLVTGLTVPSNTVLRGSGHGTVIKVTTSAVAIHLNGVSHSAVRDLKVLGSSNTALTLQRGVYLSNASSDCLVDNVWTDGCYRGIALTGVTDIIVRHCLVTNDQSDLGAIDLSGNVLRSVVEGCAVRGARIHGIDVRQNQPQHIRIIGNHIENPGNTGIVVSGGGSAAELIQYVVVQGNTINDGQFGIIVENGAHHTVVQGNTINSPSTSGILVSDGTGDAPSNTVVSANVISSVGAYGIWLNNGLMTTVANNRIVGFVTAGIRASVGTSHVLSGNLITGGTSTSGHAIRVDAGGADGGSSVVGNVVRDNAGFGIFIDSPQCTVTGNTVVDADNTGVSSLGGIQLTANASRTVVSGNVSRRTSGTKQDYGVLVAASCTNALIIGNILYQNTTAAVLDGGTGTSSVNNVTT
jgi:hypothetical protein